MDKNIEVSAAKALLNRGVAFRIPAPWLFRIFGRKNMRISVRRLYLGTLVHLSTLEQLSPMEAIDVGEAREKLIKEMGGAAASLPYKVIVENIKPVTLAVASCLLNSRLKIKLFAPLLARHLRSGKVTADYLQELIMWLFVYGRAESFTNTTKLLNRMMMTSPRNLGQMEKRS